MTPDQMNARMFAALSQIQSDVAAIKDMLSKGGAPAPAGGRPVGAPSANGPADGAIADDRDLDSEHGDVTIRFDPKEKYWTGDSYVGYRFSECPPDYLEAQAKYLDACAYMAEKDPDEKKRKSAFYKRKDAARARGWARRIRATGGHVAPPVQRRASEHGGGAPAYDQSEGAGAGNMDDLPF